MTGLTNLLMGASARVDEESGSPIEGGVEAQEATYCPECDIHFLGDLEECPECGEIDLEPKNWLGGDNYTPREAD